MNALKKQKYLAAALKAAKVHFHINNETKCVEIPSEFIMNDYPQRTQMALNRLKKLKFHLQTTIK
jgi:hypothetical protein